MHCKPPLPESEVRAIAKSICRYEPDQAAMRHSSLHLTMNIYTDPTLLDVAGAVNALPSFGTGSSKTANIGA